MEKRVDFMKDPILNISGAHLDILKEISNIGARNAATALSSLLNKTVDMKVSRVMPLPFNRIVEYIGGAENLVATVFLRIDGDINGNMFFVFGTEDAKDMIKDLTSVSGDGPFDEMGLSVLQEVGNILSGSYLTALADFSGLEFKPSIPSLAIDMAGAVLSFGLMEAGKVSDYAIFIDAEVFTDEAPLTEGPVGGKTGHFFLLPDPESFDKLFVALGVHRHGSY